MKATVCRPCRRYLGLTNALWVLLPALSAGDLVLAQGLSRTEGRAGTVGGSKTETRATGAPEASLATGSWLFASHPSGDSKIYRLNEFDGGADFIGEIGRNATGDIAFHPDGRLFGVRTCCGPGLTSDLMWINPRTGVGDLLGNMGTLGVNALVAADDGTMYAASNRGEFMTVDLETGAPTIIGSFGNDLASVGDLAFDTEGVLYATVAVNPNFNFPVPTDLATIDPLTGVATVIGATGFDDVWGLEFHPGVVLDVGGTEIRGPTLFGLTSGHITGTDPQLIVIDRLTGVGQLVATLSTDDSMSGLAANLRWSPTRGDISLVGHVGGDAGNQCADALGSWTHCQHKRPPAHAPSIDGDETFAWDANMESNLDAGEPVYSVAPGKVVSLYGEIPPGGGDSNTVLIEHCLGFGPCDCPTTPTDCWWSAYRRMVDIQVVESQLVTPSQILGFIADTGPEGVGDEHLHFSVYEGENARQAGQGLLTSVDAVLLPVPLIFADGFESGDTSEWSGSVP